MPRGLNAAQQTALAANVVGLALLAELQFTNETLYIWSGRGNLFFNGILYTGVGSYGKVSPITETQQLMAQGVTLELSGLDPNSIDINEVQNSMSLKNQVILSTVLLDPSGNVIGGSAIASYQGFMDQATIDETTQTSTVTISVESKLAQLNRSVNWTLAAPDANFWNPAEGAFQWVTYLSDYVFRFGN
ncbi:MAG TPA: hypothetical protein VFN53_06405 [Acidobacteriaceae bacterium]|nr:hypothetical protein [Acidobacteriaceae bacterium]